MDWLGKANPAPAVFIAEALDLCLTKVYAVPKELEQEFRQLAVGAIEDEVELRSRQTIGLVLGRLGDPRVLSLRDPKAYVEVPAGIYPYSLQNQRVEIAAPFLLGRFPVTNSQYQELTAVAARTALKDLNDMVAKHVLERRGTSRRDTHYVLFREMGGHRDNA